MVGGDPNAADDPAGVHPAGPARRREPVPRDHPPDGRGRARTLLGDLAALLHRLRVLPRRSPAGHQVVVLTRSSGTLWKTASRLATPATLGPSTCHCAAITGSFGVASVDDELGRAGERRGHVQLPVPDLDDDLADADEVRVEDVDADR